MIGAYKAKTSPVYSTFARQLCGGTHHLGCLLVYPAWLHLSPLQLPLHTQEAKNHIQLARNVKRFLQSFFSLIGHYKAPQTKIKGTQSLLILIATMGKDIKKNQRIWTVPLWSCDFVICFISWMFKVICSNLLKSALDLGFYTQAIPVILNSPCAYNMPTVLKKLCPHTTVLYVVIFTGVTGVKQSSNGDSLLLDVNAMSIILEDHEYPHWKVSNNLTHNIYGELGRKPHK